MNNFLNVKVITRQSVTKRTSRFYTVVPNHSKKIKEWFQVYFHMCLFILSGNRTVTILRTSSVV